MMVRQRGWERLVAEWARAHVITPTVEGFVWGQTDCWSLVIGAVQAMTCDVWDDVPLPQSAADALRATRDAVAEFGSIVAWFEAQGFTAQPGTFAATGDVLVCEPDEDYPWFGVVVGTDIILSQHDVGVVRISVRDMPANAIALTVR